MKPDVARSWEIALRRLRKAREHAVAGEDDAAIREAKGAVVDGVIAITLLLRDDDRRTWQAALDDVSDDSFVNWDSCVSAHDYVEKASKTLTHFANLSPPESKLPPPDA